MYTYGAVFDIYNLYFFIDDYKKRASPMLVCARRACAVHVRAGCIKQYKVHIYICMSIDTPVSIEYEMQFSCVIKRESSSTIKSICFLNECLNVVNSYVR